MITIDWIDEHEIKTKKKQSSHRDKVGKRQKLHTRQSQALPFCDCESGDTLPHRLKLVERARDAWQLNWLPAWLKIYDRRIKQHDPCTSTKLHITSGDDGRFA